VAGEGVALDEKDPVGLTPLARAVAINSRPCVASLLRAGADPNIVLGGGYYVVHFATEVGNAEMLQQIISSSGMDLTFLFIFYVC
jgi:ankyrin repeat protein